MDGFEAIYIGGFIIATIIRSYYGSQFKRDNIVVTKSENPLVYLGMVLWSVVLFLPFFTIFSDWLTFAYYTPYTLLQIVGAFVFITGLWILWRSHVDLGRNFSPSLFIRNRHTLVTAGVYRTIRHPMYLSFLMWALGQALLISNWLAGPLGLIAFALIYLFRIEREEKQLLETFGDQYVSYQKVTGRLIPKLK